MSELVHDLISSRMSYKDDRSLHESELRRKADTRKDNRLEVIVQDMRVWLSSESSVTWITAAKLSQEMR